MMPFRSALILSIPLHTPFYLLGRSLRNNKTKSSKAEQRREYMMIEIYKYRAEEYCISPRIM